MHRFVRSIRLSGILTAACLTLISGLVLVWFLVQPETLPLLSTWQLAAILGAFVLPALCLGAWQADRQALARAPRTAGKQASRQLDAAARSKTEATLSVAATGPRVPASAKTPSAIVAGPVCGEARQNQSVGRVSPAGRSIRSDRSVHRHRRSARV